MAIVPADTYTTPAPVRGSIGEAMKGLVRGAAQGPADCRRNWTTALVSRIGTHPTSWECAEAARIAWGGGRYKLARSAMSEQGRSKTGTASSSHVKLSPMSASGSTGDRQEHLGATVSFAGSGQRRPLVRSLDILTRKSAAFYSTHSRCSRRKRKNQPRSSLMMTSGSAR